MFDGGVIVGLEARQNDLVCTRLAIRCAYEIGRVCVQGARFLFLGALSMLLGAAMWRINLSLIAFNPGEGYHYFPKAEEVLLSLGLVAIEVSAYLLIVRLVPVLPALDRIHHAHQAKEEK